MEPDQTSTHGHGSALRAVRHHLILVVTLVVAGALAGWFYGASSPTTYTSSTRVLINPSAGNPFAPTPASVRQDQETSLETEAQVVRSAEVLDVVMGQAPGLTRQQLERGVQVSIPPSTQVLEVSFTAGDKLVAQQVADAVAAAYLANRQARFDGVTADRIDSLQTQTLRVVDDLRAATAAAQVGTAAHRAFNKELSEALRNELVSLRAQRTALENSETPPGAVIAPAGIAVRTGSLPAPVLPIGGALAGLALGCALAVLLERATRRVRSASDVETAGLPVLAMVPSRRRGASLLRRDRDDAFDTTIRRLRANLLDLEPRPDVVTIAPAGDGARPESLVSEALAESFARAGHRVVLVRTDGQPPGGKLAIEVDGLAEALQHERLSVLELLQPSVEPLLSLLPPGRFTDQTRELLDADRLRTVLEPLIEVGHTVVVQAPGIETVEGEAIVGAADLGLVVVHVGHTRYDRLEAVLRHPWRRGTSLAGVVVGRKGRHPLASSRPNRPGRGRGLEAPSQSTETTQEQSVGVTR